MPAAGFLIAAAVISAGSQIYQGARAERAADKQADLLRDQARMEREAAANEAEHARERGRRIKAAQRAALGSAGVKIDEGTGAALQKETDRLSEKDALAILKEGENRSYLLRRQANITAKRGDAAAVAGVMNGVSSLLSSYGSYKSGGAMAAPVAQSPAQIEQGETVSLPRRNVPRYALLTGNGGWYSVT